MASRSLGLGDNPNRILVAVDAHFNDMQKMPATFSLFPQPLSAAREEDSSAGLTRLGKRVCVHMPYH